MAIKFSFGKNKKYQKVCQKCGSMDLKIAVTPWKGGAAQFAEYKCQRCQFEGLPIEASEKMKKEIEKMWKRRKKK